ncbi:hypothetical protein TW86_04105 [Halomonas sp. S2151]|nr:hypothetical protein TW86_04105 [Halomonas sp. S2151]
MGAAAVAAPSSGPSPFEPEFETKIVAHVLRDATFMQQCEELVAPDFFSEQSARYLVSIAKKHYRKYESVPSSRTLVKYVKDAIKTGRIKKAMVPDIQALLKEAFEEPLSDGKFVTEEVSTFARHRALQKMMEKVIDDMEKAETTGVALDYGEIEKHMKDVVMIGANDASNGYDFFGNIAERTEVREEIASGKIKPGERSISTGYPAFDSLLYHKGWGRKEMVVFMGPPKSGKSTALGQFAINAAVAGYDTLYITLEVSDQVMSDRMDASMSGTPMAELTDRSSLVREEIEKLAASSGKLILHQYPTGSFTPNQLVRLIEHYKARGTVFDMVVVDYGDIMAPNHRTTDPIENSKSIYVDLRAAAMAYDVALLTATQTNRDGAKAAVATMTEVAEDFNKIRIADLVISINKSEEEKANQEARLYFAASRNQKSDICIRVKQDLERMQFLKKIIDVT